MKFLILIGDGMADFPLAELGGQTPLAAARTPAMDTLAREGLLGLFCPIPPEFPPGSDIGNLSLFGYDPHEVFTGRAPLEAANQGIALEENQLAFRCNLVTIEDETMIDFTADHIADQDAHAIIATLNETLADDFVRFAPGVSYRHLAIVTAPETEPLARLKCTPPHDITNRAIASYLPQGSGNDPILSLMQRSREVLADHPVNRKRAAAGHRPATSIWLWGQGRAPRIQPYRERFGIAGAVISAVDLVNGIGRCAGLEVIRVPGATGYVDTNYEGKVAAALDALTRADFAYVHIEAPDEASHEGDCSLKIRAIEDFDRRVVRPCFEAAKAMGNCRILVAPDHITSIDTRTHAQGPVPFVAWGPGIEAHGATRYCEEEALKFGVLFAHGHALTPALIQSEHLQ